MVTFLILLTASCAQDQPKKLARPEIPELRVETETRVVGRGPLEITKHYRGDVLILETHARYKNGECVHRLQQLYVNGEIVLRISRTENYHLKSFGQPSPWSMEEVDLDLNGTWDLLQFENDARDVIEAALISADGFLEPVSSELLNQANKVADEPPDFDREWLLKHLATELRKRGA